MTENKCIICFEICDDKKTNYECKNNCFFNESNCYICSQCLDTWISYDEEAIIFKCPICAHRKLKDKNKKCVYHCSCNIGCNNIIYPDGIIFYRSGRIRETCRYILVLITFVLFLEIIGFILTNLWFWTIKYDNNEYNNKIRNGKWLEPSYYLIDCPFTTLILILIVFTCGMICKCLDNIC